MQNWRSKLCYNGLKRRYKLCYVSLNLLNNLKTFYLTNLVYKLHTRLQIAENAYVASYVVTTTTSSDHLREPRHCRLSESKSCGSGAPS